MKIYHSLLVVGALIASGQMIAGTKQLKVIYGEDNRQDVFESTDSVMVDLSKSTAAMISASNLKTSGDEVSIIGSSLQSRGICAKERFSKQVTAANCSGFLVSDKYLVTAGHCIKTMEDCKNYKWVFDYKVDHSEQTSVRVPKSSIYSCKAIVERALDSINKDDYAMIELDRIVDDRNPLAFRKSGEVSAGDSVVVIGHPTGLPTKISGGARVRKTDAKYFVANLDTFGGNSGSAVFNAKTSTVEGILVRGEADYIPDSAAGCQVSNRCTESGCRGEDVTFITNIKALKKL